ncbi:helix-turn-helix domain-containing protein [Streptomyces sp. SID1328]|uniref:helix-turn-helix domain-containing protein n=1 Tax=Streptomyces sp. SID1328 TaxID=2690250 RepID=UPI001F2787A2|nr:helix-turn-helix domain-containing protein [Streptomyces sp. SID1328]
MERLFEIVHPPERGPFTNEEVAQQLEQRHGQKISSVYLWKLRTGRNDNPTKRVLEALSKFFGVPASYFFDDEEAAEVTRELEQLRMLRDAGVERVAHRLSGLSPESMRGLLSHIDRVRAAENLPPATAHLPSSST